MTNKASLLSEDAALTVSVLGDGYEVKDSAKRFMDPLVTRTFPTIVLLQHCSDCIYCQDSCPNLKLDEKNRTMILNETACKGCGICIAACPTGAMQQRNSWFGALSARVMEVLGQEKQPPQDCNRCHLRLGTISDTSGLSRPVVRLLCSGRAEPGAILEAVTSGCDGVFVCGCFYDVDFFGKNEGPLDKRKPLVSKLVSLLNIPDSKVRYNNQSLTKNECVEDLNGFVKGLGGGE